MPVIPSLKKITKHLAIEEIPDPDFFHIPLEGYRSEMAPVINTGESIKKYQLIAQSENSFATKVHAPVSGIYIGIKEIDGKKNMILKNDFKNFSEEKLSIDLHQLSYNEFVKILENYGIEGSGGARFPSHLKYKKENNISTFIVNGAECEPYLSSDYVVIKHKTDELIKALWVIKTVLQTEKIVFGIEKENKELKKIVEESAKKNGLQVEVTLLKNEYPQGGELQLIKAVTGLELRKGEIPAQYGIIVQNIGTLHAIYKAFYESIPFIERIVTVSGNNSITLGNYSVKIGTPIEHILHHTQNITDKNSHSVVLGGAMMGKAVRSLSNPIHKGSGGILLLKNPQTKDFNCIGCGYCVDVCPQKLMPLEFVRYYLQKDLDKLKAEHLNDCIECGACAYVCPSEVPLMNSIFQGKLQINSQIF